MLKGFTPGKIYLATGFTDLRRGIDGLAGIIQEQFQLDAFNDTLFLFCGRRNDRIEYTGAVKPPVRKFGNRDSGRLETGMSVS